MVRDAGQADVVREETFAPLLYVLSTTSSTRRSRCTTGCRRASRRASSPPTCARASASWPRPARTAASPTSTSARAAPRSAGRSAARRRPAAGASPARTPGRRTCAARPRRQLLGRAAAGPGHPLRGRGLDGWCRGAALFRALTGRSGGRAVAQARLGCLGKPPRGRASAARRVDWWTPTPPADAPRVSRQRPERCRSVAPIVEPRRSSSAARRGCSSWTAPTACCCSAAGIPTGRRTARSGSPPAAGCRRASRSSRPPGASCARRPGSPWASCTARCTSGSRSSSTRASPTASSNAST